MSKENMITTLLKLEPRERVILLNVLRRNRTEWRDINMGSLQFLPRQDVVEWFIGWCSGLTIDTNRRRIHREICHKLLPNPPPGPLLVLDSTQVRMRFGEHPERGFTIPILPTRYKFRERKPGEETTKGIHWDGKNWVPSGRGKDAKSYAEIVQPIVSLRREAYGWRLTCDDDVRDAAVEWLMNNVGTYKRR